MEAAGYSDYDARQIKSRVTHFKDARDIVKNASGEYLDLKAYEADMRRLIDTYVEADEPRPISNFDDMSLIELIVNSAAARQSTPFKHQEFKGWHCRNDRKQYPKRINKKPIKWPRILR